MKAHMIHLLTAAALLGSASVPLSAQLSDKSPTPATKNLGEKLQQLGTQQADPTTAAQARQSLAQLINDATSLGHFPSLLTRLAKADRDRIGDLPRENYDNLHKVITRFRQDFQAKYHQEFTFQPEMLKAADVNLGATKNALTVSLDDAQKNPAVSGPTITLVNEGGPQTALWKIDIPNEMSGRQLKDALTKHLQKLEDQKATWPDDVQATYHAAASEILQALNDSSIAVDQ